MRAVSIGTDAMLIELGITFPTLRKRALREFGGSYAEVDGVWTSQDTGHDMPDGYPIFNSLANGDDSPEYDGTVHSGFMAWLDARGWYCERYDGATYFLLRDADLPDFPEWPPCAPLQPGEVPF